MPKIRKPSILGKEIIAEYDYEKIRERVLSYFYKYRRYMNKIDLIESSYNACLSNDNLGILSSKISDPTGIKVQRMEEEKRYIDMMNKSLKSLKFRLTTDEKIILEYSILSNHTDDDLAFALSLDKSNIYQRKKSCFIKVAIYYQLEVMR